jgi:hypothetical protein
VRDVGGTVGASEQAVMADAEIPLGVRA